jgi:Ca-activated chloride channel family protein
MKKTIVVVMLLAAVCGCEQSPAPNKAQSSNPSSSQDSRNAQAQPEVAKEAAESLIPPNAEVAVTKNFYFVIDGSGSMNDASPSREERSKFRSKMEGAKQAVAEAISLVPNDANLGLFVFDGRGASERVAIGPGKHSAILQSVNSILANGGTPLAESIQYGVDVLDAQRSKQLGYGEYRLIVVTDGEAWSVPDAIAYANQRQIPIYGIGLGVKSNHPLRNGTIYSDAKSIDELTRALKETVGEMADFDSSELFK